MDTIFRTTATGSTDGDRLLACFKNVCAGLPPEAIIEAWASHGTPSAVGHAFFMHPHDGAVAFFERHVMPLATFENEFAPETIQFARRCRNEAITVMIRDAVEDLGPEDVARRITSGFRDSEVLRTCLIEAAGQ